MAYTSSQLVGDIVMIQDSGKIKGKWRLGKVVKADPSSRDGLVRQVEIMYKNPESRSFIKVIRAVQRVVVISPIDHDEEYDKYLKDSISMRQ